MSQITVSEFEQKVMDKEEIVIVLRAPLGAKVEDYDYERKATGDSSLTEWLDRRIRPLIGNIQVAVVAGDYSKQVHGRTKLSNLRDGYSR